jgi:hypothetical protein
MSVKYYFITYEYKKHEYQKEWERSNVVTNVHPVKWLKRMIDLYSEEETYHILFYNEITKEEFLIIDGWIN